MRRFTDRYDAGRALARELIAYADREDVIVLALPRGGVPVAYEIAHALSLPLEIFIVRKLGVPGHEELAMGAIASLDTIVFNDEIITSLQLTESAIERVIQKEQEELKRRELAYRGNRPLPILKNKTVILVDDGIATGATMRTAVKALRKLNPFKIIVAVPVADISIGEIMEQEADEFVCPLKTEFLYAVGNWYLDFSQTEDEEVMNLLEKIRRVD